MTKQIDPLPTIIIVGCLIAICINFAMGSGRRAIASPKRTVWEYTVLDRNTLGDESHSNYLNRLGGDGWELSAVVDGKWIFIRPRY